MCTHDKKKREIIIHIDTRHFVLRIQMMLLSCGLLCSKKWYGKRLPFGAHRKSSLNASRSLPSFLTALLLSLHSPCFFVCVIYLLYVRKRAQHIAFHRRRELFFLIFSGFLKLLFRRHLHPIHIFHLPSASIKKKHTFLPHQRHPLVLQGDRCSEVGTFVCDHCWPIFSW